MKRKLLITAMTLSIVSPVAVMASDWWGLETLVSQHREVAASNLRKYERVVDYSGGVADARMPVRVKQRLLSRYVRAVRADLLDSPLGGADPFVLYANWRLRRVEGYIAPWQPQRLKTEIADIKRSLGSWARKVQE